MSNRYILTPEQIQLSEERKAKKARDAEAKTANTLPMSDEEKGIIFDRKWVQFPLSGKAAHSVTIMGWNMLAQCLVRKLCPSSRCVHRSSAGKGSDLFPTSSCLKAPRREKMTLRELRRGAQVMCLQEVDRLDKIIPMLQQCGYAHVYASGPNKKHGCLIAFKKAIFSNIGQKVIYYDEEIIREGEGDTAAASSKGCSHRTKNIGSIVALHRTDDATVGYIIGTTHLFWHPRYTYERTRQAGILVRELIRFRDSTQRDWPCIIAGDFNFTPSDPAYSLIVGGKISPVHSSLLESSRVVHASIDPSVKASGAKLPEEEEGGDQDKIITNARKAVLEDGFLSDEDLAALYTQPFRSAMAEAQQKHRMQSATDLVTFGDRVGIPQEEARAHEPNYTSYTHYWKSVLDYTFILSPPDATHSVTGYLAFPKAADLEPGLPQTNKCSSDHLAQVAEISWSTPTQST